MQKVTIPREQLVHMYSELGMSSHDISVKLDCCDDATIIRRLREYNIPVRNKVEGRNMPRCIAKSSQYNLVRYQDPHEIEKTRQALLKYHHNNPYARKVAHEGQVRRFNDPNEREKDRQGQLRRYENPLEREKSSEAQLKHWKDPVAIEKHRQWALKHWQKPNERARRGAILREYYKNNTEALAKSKERQRKVWDNLTTEQRNAWVKAIIESNQRKPTTPELELKHLLDSVYPYEWKYTGNGEVVIGGLNPDFININGKKQIIEMFGDYWHSKARTGKAESQDVRHRHRIYAKYGFRTLVIWERELNNKSKVMNKITKFTQSDKSILDYLRPLYKVVKAIHDLWKQLKPMRNIRRGNSNHGH